MRLDEPGEGVKRLLRLQGLGLWHGDLAEMRGDSPRSNPADLDVTAPSTTEAAGRMVMVLRIKAAFEQLSSQEREALRLRYDDGLPLEEIAKSLGVDINQASALIDRALQKVSKV